MFEPEEGTPAPVAIRAGQRALFVGLPEYGKTNLMMWLLEDVRSIVVMDSKMHAEEWAPWARRRGGLVTSEPDDILRAPIVAFQVDQVALDDRHGWKTPGRPGYRWTEALVRCMERGNTVVVFDEVLQTLPAGASHPEARRIYTQGRAFGLSCWAGTQIANRMDTLVARIAEHCFAFATFHGKDVQLLSDARSVDCGPLAELPKHHFGYHYIGTREWVLCDPVDNVVSGSSRPENDELETDLEPSTDAQSEDQNEPVEASQSALAEDAEAR